MLLLYLRFVGQERIAYVTKNNIKIPDKPMQIKVMIFPGPTEQEPSLRQWFTMMSVFRMSYINLSDSKEELFTVGDEEIHLWEIVVLLILLTCVLVLCFCIYKRNHGNHPNGYVPLNAEKSLTSENT